MASVINRKTYVENKIHEDELVYNVKNNVLTISDYSSRLTIFSNATTCLLWTSWTSLSVVAEV
jgi:hypothetical protein